MSKITHKESQGTSQEYGIQYKLFNYLIHNRHIYTCIKTYMFMCISQVDTAAQIPWYERLSELKMPWEMCGNKQTAIKDLNLRVHSGQMLAVIGSSGRNQSTLLDRIHLKLPGYLFCIIEQVL